MTNPFTTIKNFFTTLKILWDYSAHGQDGLCDWDILESEEKEKKFKGTTVFMNDSELEGPELSKEEFERALKEMDIASKGMRMDAHMGGEEEAARGEAWLRKMEGARDNDLDPPPGWQPSKETLEAFEKLDPAHYCDPDDVLGTDDDAKRGEIWLREQEALRLTKR